MKKGNDGGEEMGFKLKETLIAIPPLAVQQTVIAEIESEQALVSANRELANRMKKKIPLAIARVWEQDV